MNDILDPSTLKAIRHPVILNKEVPYAKKFEEELLLDHELGLKNQMNIDAKRFFSKDIDELTRTEDYHEVSLKVVERMFKMRLMKFACFLHNIVESFTVTFKQFFMSLIYIIICAASAFGTYRLGVFIYMSQNDLYQSLGIISAIVTGVISISFLIFALMEPFMTVHAIEVPRGNDDDFTDTHNIDVKGIKLDFFFLKVFLKIEPVEDTELSIPRGAKLRMLEAKKTGIFEGFSIAYPVLEKRHVKYHRFLKQREQPTDPVLLGITKDNRFFLIAWWDIKKDIDRIQKDLKILKKFKV